MASGLVASYCRQVSNEDLHLDACYFYSSNLINKHQGKGLILKKNRLLAVFLRQFCTQGSFFSPRTMQDTSIQDARPVNLLSGKRTIVFRYSEQCAALAPEPLHSQSS